MIIKNNIEKPFGSSGSWTGIFLFIGGGIITCFSLFGLVLAIPGAFIGFTYSAAIIDVEMRRVKSATYLFGIVPIGKWIDLKPNMKLGVKRMHKGNRTSTRAHSHEFHNVDYIVVLYIEGNQQIISISKAETLELADAELRKLSEQLKLATI